MSAGDRLSVPPSVEAPKVGDRVIRIGLVVSLTVVTLVAVVISYGHLYDLATDQGEDGAAAAVLPVTVDGLILACSLVIVNAARGRVRPPVLAWLMLLAGIGATLAGNVAHGIEHGWPGALVAGWPAVVAAGCFHLVIGEIRRGRETVETVTNVTADGLVWWPLPDAVTAAQAGDGAPSGDRREPVPGPVATTGREAVTGGPEPVPALEPGQPEIGSESEPISEPDPELAEVLATARDRFAELLAAGQLPSVRRIRRELRVGHPRAAGIRSALANGHRE